MSGPESEQVLGLLKELSILRELGRACDANAQSEPVSDARQRETRCQEITEEIRTLARQKKDRDEQPA
jgi:hypothetical protein